MKRRSHVFQVTRNGTPSNLLLNEVSEMRVIKGKANRNIALDALASGAIFKPLKSDYSGRYSSACGRCILIQYGSHR